MRRGRTAIIALVIGVLILLLLVEGFTTKTIGASSTGPSSSAQAPLAGAGPILTAKGNGLKGIGRGRNPGRQIALDELALAVDRKGVPDPGEDAEQVDFDVRPLADRLRLVDEGLKGRRDIGVAGDLAAGERAGVAAQIRQVLDDQLSCRHSRPLVTDWF